VDVVESLDRLKLDEQNTLHEKIGRIVAHSFPIVIHGDSVLLLDV